jgi:hypothetical protein
MANWRQSHGLTRKRIWVAYGVAVFTDAVQVALGPLGWTFVDEILDLIAMGAISWAIGFHPLLLPTFVVEILPVVDMVPTWTAATAMVVFFRRRSAQAPPRPGEPVIEVEATAEPVDRADSAEAPKRP